MEVIKDTRLPQLLVIDDEPAALRLLRLVLTRHDYEVASLTNVNDALKFLEQNRVDLIITDAVMPDLTGLDLVRAVRAHPRLAEIPVLMLTRKRMREDVNAAVIAGVNDYIVKPIDENLLLDKVEFCLKKGAGKRHIYEHRVNEEHGKSHLRLPSSIVAISEADVTIHTSMSLDSGMPFALEAPVFEEIGIGVPMVRFLDCQLIERSREDGQLTFESRYGFVGVPEADLRKIRAWLHKQALQRRK